MFTGPYWPIVLTGGLRDVFFSIVWDNVAIATARGDVRPTSRIAVLFVQIGQPIVSVSNLFLTTNALEMNE
jgi:hypothetical protein